MLLQRRVPWIFLLIILFSCNEKEKIDNNFKSDNMIIRISEIVIDSIYLEEYVSILKEESEASVRLESGVISIYPMFQKKKPNEIRILEIYKNIEAYQSHLQTKHFKHYKTTTLKMVKSLKLVDMNAIDGQSMPMIFKKIK